MPYLFHRTRPKSVDQFTQHYPIFQRGLQELLWITYGLLGGIENPQGDKPCDDLLFWIHDCGWPTLNSSLGQLRRLSHIRDCICARLPFYESSSCRTKLEHHFSQATVEGTHFTDRRPVAERRLWEGRGERRNGGNPGSPWLSLSKPGRQT